MSALNDTKSESEIVLDRLERLLRRSNAFTLAFVKSNDFSQRGEMSRILIASIPNKRVLEVDLTEPLSDDPLRSLLDELLSRWNIENPADAIFVYGFENSIGVEFSPNILRLNNDRELFQRFFPVPVILWLPDFAIDYIARGAPDFWAWRSGVYEFPFNDRELQGDASVNQPLEANRDWAIRSWPLEEKRNEVRRLEDLYNSAASLPYPQRSDRDNARLADRIGNLYLAMSDFANAERWELAGLDICRQLGDRQGEGRALMGLGNVYDSRGRWDKAEEAYNESLAIRRQLGDRQGEGSALMGLGNVYDSRGRWDKAEEAYNESLVICRQLGDRQGEGSALGNLGNVYYSRGRWDKAEEAYNESLAIRRQLGDRQGEGSALMGLGNVYDSRGRWDKAEEAYNESLVICRQLGDRQGEGSALGNLGNVYRSRGDWDKAEKAFQESRTIAQELGGIPV